MTAAHCNTKESLLKTQIFFFLLEATLSLFLSFFGKEKTSRVYSFFLSTLGFSLGENTQDKIESSLGTCFSAKTQLQLPALAAVFGSPFKSIWMIKAVE